MGRWLPGFFWLEKKVTVPEEGDAANDDEDDEDEDDDEYDDDDDDEDDKCGGGGRGGRDEYTFLGLIGSGCNIQTHLL